MGIKASKESIYKRINEMIANQVKFGYTPPSPNPYSLKWDYNGWQNKPTTVEFTFEEPDVKPGKNANEEWAEKWIGENQTKYLAKEKKPSTPGSKPSRTTNE